MTCLARPSSGGASRPGSRQWPERSLNGQRRTSGHADTDGLTILRSFGGNDAARRRCEYGLTASDVPGAYLSVGCDKELPHGIVIEGEGGRRRGLGEGDARRTAMTGSSWICVCGHEDGGERHLTA